MRREQVLIYCKALTLIWSVCFVLGFRNAYSAPAEGPKHVLILDSYGRRFAPFSTVGTAFETELAEHYPVPVQFHEVSLEAEQFTNSDLDELTVKYVQTMFGAQKPDLVVPFGGLAVRFALRMRPQLFPSAPLLLAAVDARHLKTFTLDTNTTALPSRIDFPFLIENICRILPDTTNIAVVLGSTAHECYLKQEMQRDLAGFTNLLGFTWLDHYSLEELQRRVRDLPPHTVIFYYTLFVDAGGVPYEYDRVTKFLAAEANAPVVGLFEEELGFGVVGGPVLNLREMGAETAQVAVRILDGERPKTVDLPAASPGTPIYDWRALRRWNISTDRLPPGSMLKYVRPTVWERHKNLIISVSSLVLALSIFIAGIMVNLNRRRTAEHSLHESEERMKLAASAAALGMWEWDFATNKVLVDGARPAGASSENGKSGEAQFERFLRTVHPEDQEEVAAALAKAIVGDGNYQQIHRQVLEDGQVRWIAARGMVEFDAGNKPVKMRGVAIDITERKLAEDRARESERQFILTANAAPVFIWASGPDKLTTFLNLPWLNFRGRTLEQELGTGWAEGIHPDDLANTNKVYQEAFDARQPFTLEARVRRHDGQYRWVLSHGVPRYDEQKQFLGYIGTCIDMTEKREAEAESQRWQQELAHVSRLSTLWALAGSLAHELRQPLAAIVNSAEAGRRFMKGERKNEAEVCDALSDIAEQGERAGEIITEMRAMLKRDSGEMAAQDLNLVIKTVIEIVRSDLVAHHVTTELRLDPQLPPVNGHGVQLRQVVLNLVMNACDAVADKPAGQRTLTIKSRRVTENEVEVLVADTGPGFPEEMLRSAFEPFRTTKDKGLGLGLAICRSIITAHEGQLVLANNSADGTAIVKFTLPAKKVFNE